LQTVIIDGTGFLNMLL